MEELKTIRKNLDALDAELLDMFVKRMELIDQVAVIKRESGLPLCILTREQHIIDRANQITSPYNGGAFMKALIELSKSRQKELGVSE